MAAALRQICGLRFVAVGFFELFGFLQVDNSGSGMLPQFIDLAELRLVGILKVTAVVALQRLRCSLYVASQKRRLRGQERAFVGVGSHFQSRLQVRERLGVLPLLDELFPAIKVLAGFKVLSAVDQRESEQQQ
jgi:hypothetical protein